MLWFVGGLIVDMHIGTFNVWQRFEFDLQLLGNIVCRHQSRGRVHDNINLDQQTRTRCISTNSVDGIDHGGVGHSCEC